MTYFRALDVDGKDILAECRATSIIRVILHSNSHHGICLFVLEQGPEMKVKAGQTHQTFDRSGGGGEGYPSEAKHQAGMAKTYLQITQKKHRCQKIATKSKNKMQNAKF